MSPHGRHWRGLLVSVRDADEAREAVAGGAAIVDVKEPAHGPLGAPAPAVAAAVADAVGDRVPWTLACGELVAGAAGVVAAVRAALPASSPLPAAAKAGPAGLDAAGWRRACAGFIAALPAGVEPVAVAYADWLAAASPPPEAMVAAAREAGCRTLLVDTFDKTAPGVMAGASAVALPAWIARARAAGLAIAVAGRLAGADLARAVALGADVVAVRSAACRGGRAGRVDRALVAAAAAEVRRGLLDSPTLSRAAVAQSRSSAAP